MDLDLGYLSKGLTKRSILGQCGGSLTSSESDVDDFAMNMVNDFTTNKLKEEADQYDAKKTIQVVQVCAAYHGGPLDYPKTISKSVSAIIEAWNKCFLQTQRPLEKIRLEEDHTMRSSGQCGGGGSSIDMPNADCGNSDEEVYQQLMGNVDYKQNEQKANRAKISSTRHSTPLEEVTELGIQDFFGAVSESCTKIAAHSKNMIKKMLVNGDNAGLLAIVGGLAMARNKVWFFNETTVISPKIHHPFNDNYREMSELVESSAEQIVNYQMSLAATTVLHDASSQNWTEPKAFYEGEKISHCIQMWWYYLQGLHYDLWNSLPPKIASNMFAKIFDHTYGILVGRYSKVTPSAKRLPQFRGDVTTMLLIASEVLTYIAPSTSQIFNTAGGGGRGGGEKPKPYGGQNVWNIHSKSRLLFTTLALVGSPLHALYKSALDCMKPKLKSAGGALPPLDIPDDNSFWLHMIRPGIFHSPNPDALCAESHLVILAKLAANQAAPSWPLVVQVVLGHNMMVAKVILLHFGAFVPGSVNRSAPPPMVNGEGGGAEQGGEEVGGEAKSEKPAGPKSMIDGCDGFQCKKLCIGPADINWPQAVGSGVLKIVLHGATSKDCLGQVLEILLTRMSSGSWEAISRSQLPNHRRPVWVQAVIHLIEPYIFPAMLDLMEAIDTGRTWTLNQVGTAMKEVLTASAEMVEIIPIPVLRLCTRDIQSRLPSGVEPLDNSVFAHFVVCALYDMTLRMHAVLKREGVCPKEKIDFVEAFGEALINLDGGGDVQELAKAAKKAVEEDEAVESDATEEDELMYDSVTNEFSFIMAEKTAGDILHDEDGKFALKALHRFICYNVDWIQSSLSVGPSVSASPNDSSAGANIMPALIKPWGSEIQPPASPFDMMNKIGASAHVGGGGGHSVAGADVGSGGRHPSGTDPVSSGLTMGYNRLEGDFRIVRILEIHHPWDHYLRYVFARTKDNKLLYEQLIGRRTEFISVLTTNSAGDVDGLIVNDLEIDVFVGLQADEKLMLETTLQLIKEGEPPPANLSAD